ncbi:MAG: NrdJb [Gammaproteobacteria bacterium]|nr:NrdJb [Gammaproteobacteria bacterium]
MAIKIDQKIVSFGVNQTEEPAIVDDTPPKAEVIQMHEKLERPEMLLGSTYKLKTPLSEHALYVTINDVVLNAGTEHEQRRPFEVFINSKNMEHFQWIVALTRIISAVFRKGGDVTFLVEELHSVFDPRGGYFKKGGKYMPSLVAEIGDAIEIHLTSIGLLKKPELEKEQRELVDKKREEYMTRMQPPVETGTVEDGTAAGALTDDDGAAQYPAGASLCAKCSTQAVIMMDGCMTCLSCGDSKCG